MGETEPQPSQAVAYRIRIATIAIEKARFLRMAAGKRPSVSLRGAIRQHEARARRMLLEAEELARSEEESAWLEGAIAESEALALARGELVEADKAGARWMVDRGMGLQHARLNGYLRAKHGPDQTEDLFRAGVAYGQAYEIVKGLVSHRGEGGGGFGPKGPQVRVVEAGELLALMRRNLTPRQSRVLDLVCGEGLGLHQAAQDPGGASRGPALRNALRNGLAIAMKAWRSAGRDHNDHGAGLTAAAAAVSRAGRRP